MRPITCLFLAALYLLLLTPTDASAAHVEQRLVNGVLVDVLVPDAFDLGYSGYQPLTVGTTYGAFAVLRPTNALFLADPFFRRPLVDVAVFGGRRAIVRERIVIRR